jgi:hypothetical protein
MDDISTFLFRLRQSFLEERRKEERLRELESEFDRSRLRPSRPDPSRLDPSSFESLIDPHYGALIQKQVARVREELTACRNDMDHLVKLLLRLPPWHSRHQSALARFFQEGDFERSVFVMTKFPEGDSELDKGLKAVIKAVCTGLTARGLTPRLAKGARFHDWLWDEVEIHLLGCATGIAIVEDRYRPELNPNVAMEWGWMRAMGKRVLFLREKGFAHGRADLGGLRAWSFDWDDPELGVLTALEEWIGQPQRAAEPL